MFLNSLRRSYFSSSSKLSSVSSLFSYNSSITLMWYFDNRNWLLRPSPTLNSNEYLFSHSSGSMPKVPSFNCTNDCLFSNAFFISSIPTRCSPNSISTLASNQSSPLLTWICVLGLAVLKRKFRNASKPKTGTFISFMASTNKKNQLFRNTSAPFNTKLFLLSSGLTNSECRLSNFVINFSSASLLRCMISILSPSGMVMLSLSVAFVSNPL